jgi:hypothetical protein
LSKEGKQAVVSTLSVLSAQIMAVGALGTAAFGLVDALKALPGGGISRAGFGFIRAVITKLTPPDPGLDQSGLGRESVLYTLESQWINGVDSGDQLNIAKSQIKLRLTQTTAPSLTSTTGVDGAILTSVAVKIASGTALTQQETDAYGRFDLMLTTLLDQAYQRGDQRYRNAAKVTAVPVAVLLALIGAHVLPSGTISYGQAALLGLISTPIAPIAKDLSTAISNSAQALQSFKD